MPGLVHPGADGDDTAERPMAPGERRHALVVDAVLEVDDHTGVWGKKSNAEERGPIGVIALDGQEHGIERLLDALRFVQLQRFRVDQVVAAGAAQAESLLL